MTELPELYDRYFTVLPATTPELRDAAHALRYQVYCVEHSFLSQAANPGGLEYDEYDAHSVHAVLVYRPRQEVVGCVRLVLPKPGDAQLALPMRALLDERSGARLDACDPMRTAEISRYAVTKALRRRRGEHLYPDVDQLSEADMRRLVPHVTVGLIRGVALLAAERGITKVCAAMAPALARLLERFGLAFEPLGPVIDYHGQRQPCMADIEALLDGMARRNAEYFRLIEPIYRGAAPAGR